MPRKTVRLGTRGSALARAQAEIAKRKIKLHAPALNVEIVIVETAGDRDLSTALFELGGKGVFIRELEVALLHGEIDIAVHSFKDVTTRLANGLTLAGFFAAESPCDVWISRDYPTLNDVPAAGTVGTGSLRRKALLRRLRPDLELVPIRGNVGTRIDLIQKKGLAGVILSEAGLIRLGRSSEIRQRLQPEEFVPAPGQGVIALETHEDQGEWLGLCEAVSDAEQLQLSQIDLAFLEEVGFDCRVPLGFYACMSGEQVLLRAYAANTSLTEHWNQALRVAVPEAVETARKLGMACRQWMQ